MRKSTHSLIISKEGRKKMIDQVKHSVVGELYKTGEKYQARVYHGTIKLYSKRCPLKYRLILSPCLLDAAHAPTSARCSVEWCNQL